MGQQAEAQARQVRVRLTRSLIGHTRAQRRVVWALGLRRVGAARLHTLTPQLEGAVRKVQHLVTVEEVEHGRHR